MQSSTTYKKHTLALAIQLACNGLVYSAALALPALWVSVASAQSTAEQQVNFTIPAGALSAALNRFAEQSGLYLSGAGDLLAGKNSNGLQGRFTVSEGLQTLLAGSGLTMRFTGENTVTIEAASQDGVLVLPSVKVSGTTLTSVTEGSGSYASGPATTATKLGLTLRETPQSVTVVTRQQLDDIGAQTLTDVMSNITGIVVSANDTERTNFVSRGYTIRTYQVDGVNTSFSNGYIRLVSDPAIYDHIEVLRGAAGKTLGAGDPGGTINQVRKRPGQEFAGSVKATLGRWANQRLELDVGGPIALDGKIRGRFVTVHQEAESFRDWYESDKAVYYGILEADLGDSSTFSVGYDYQSPENSGVTWGTIPYWLSDGSLANLPRSFNPAARWSQWNIRQKQFFSRFEHQFNNDWSMRLSYTDDDQKVYGHRWFGGAGYFPNADGTGKSAWYGGGDNFAEGKTWDLDINGEVLLFGRRHQLNVGYHREKSDNRSPAYVSTQPDDFFTVIPDWRNWDGVVPEFSIDYLDYNSDTATNEQAAFYFASRLDLSDRLKAVIGARLSNWEQENLSYQSSNELYSRTGYEVKNELTPYISMLYDLNQYFTAYASYTDIFTPQNYRDFNGNYIDPVTGNHYEVGVKGAFLNNSLNTTLAVFRSQKDNLAEIDDSGQLAEGAFDPSNPPAGYSDSGYRFIPGTEELAYRSTGKGNEVSGGEVEIQGAISPDWNISGGYTYVEMEDKNGDKIQTYLPRNTMRLRTGYRLGGAWNKLTLGGGITWQSKTWANVNNVPTGAVDGNGRAITESRQIVQSDFFLVNLSSSYKVNDHFSLSFNINNLLDEKYYSRVGFYSGVMYGTPRDYRLSLRYLF